MSGTKGKSGVYVRTKPVWNKGKKGLQKSWLNGKKGYKNKGSFMAGELHWNWRGGIDMENTKIRHSDEYKSWRNSVYERDNFTCRVCGIRCNNKNITAHHNLSFENYPHLRLAIDNGITLCRKCHSRLHKNYEQRNKIV